MERLSAAKLWMTASGAGNAAYLSAALYAMPTVLTAEVETIASDEHWRVYVNHTWIDVVEIPVLAGHLSHLVWHLLRDHGGRARSIGVGKRESKAWSKAADLTVSQALAAGGNPLRGLPDPASLGMRENLSAEEYFTLLERMGATPSTGELCDCGSAADGLQRGCQVPDDVTPGISSVSGDALRQQIAIEFRSHMNGRGSTPGEWARWVEQVLEPKVPWQQVLSASVRRAVAWTHGGAHPTYRKLSRRQAGLPSRDPARLAEAGAGRVGRRRHEWLDGRRASVAGRGRGRRGAASTGQRGRHREGPQLRRRSPRGRTSPPCS